jgi:3-hydroxyacyl-[acyl-carrier-protein] dehydratase
MENLDPPLNKPVMEVTDIMAILPHRYPFLMLDRVIELERKTRIVAIKNITMNEPYFQGHFPDYPIMPGVMVIEAIAQAGGVLVLLDVLDREEKLMVFTGIERAKFRLPAIPGDQLRIDCKVLQWRSRAVRIEGRVTINGQLACEATISCGLKDRAKPSHELTTVSAAAAVPVADELVPELVTADVE